MPSTRTSDSALLEKPRGSTMSGILAESASDCRVITSPERKEFLLTEYSALRNEILDDLRESRSTERYAVTGAGAVWMWMWLGTQKVHVRWAWGIPLVFALRGYLRHKAILKHLGRLVSTYALD